MAVALEEGGGVDNHRQFDHLAHLQFEKFQVEPAARPIDRDANAGNVQDKEQDERVDEKAPAVLVVEMRGHDVGDPGTDEAGGVKQGLPDAVVIRVAVMPHRFTHGGRGDHHHADGNQRAPGKEQPDVGKFHPLPAARPFLAVVEVVDVPVGDDFLSRERRLRPVFQRHVLVTS